MGSAEAHTITDEVPWSITAFLAQPVQVADLREASLEAHGATVQPESLSKALSHRLAWQTRVQLLRHRLQPRAQTPPDPYLRVAAGKLIQQLHANVGPLELFQHGVYNNPTWHGARVR
jgi:hypothetical protein